MKRRAFLKAILLGPAFASVAASMGGRAAVQYSMRGISLAEVNRITVERLLPMIIDSFDPGNVLLRHLRHA